MTAADQTPATEVLVGRDVLWVDDNAIEHVSRVVQVDGEYLEVAYPDPDNPGLTTTGLHRNEIEVQPAPAADSERVEQIRARWYEHHIDPADRDARVLLLTEVDVPWLLAEHDRLTALLAEQAATIREQVAQAIEAERDAQATLRPISDAMYYGYTKAADAARTAALGSQRTEGQG